MKGKLLRISKLIRNNIVGFGIGVGCVIATGGVSAAVLSNNNTANQETVTAVTEETTTNIEETTSAMAEETTVVEPAIVNNDPVVEEKVEAPNAQYFGYEMHGNGTIFITSYNGNETNLVIPQYINGYQVTGIADDFSGVITGDNVTSVVIPEGVTYIGQCAFRCTPNVSSISIPSTVTTIKSGAFMGCADVPSLVIPSSVILIDSTTAFLVGSTKEYDERTMRYTFSDVYANIAVYSGSYAEQWCISNNIPYTLA